MYIRFVNALSNVVSVKDDTVTNWKRLKGRGLSHNSALCNRAERGDSIGSYSTRAYNILVCFSVVFVNVCLFHILCYAHACLMLFFSLSLFLSFLPFFWTPRKKRAIRLITLNI